MNCVCIDLMSRLDSRLGHKEKGKIPDVVDVTLLKDVPQWFRSLRLHKYVLPVNLYLLFNRYTPLFIDVGYKVIIQMSDADLEARGVSALGARRKMLKVFEMVKEYVAINGEV